MLRGEISAYEILDLIKGKHLQRTFIIPHERSVLRIVRNRMRFVRWMMIIKPYFESAFFKANYSKPISIMATYKAYFSQGWLKGLDPNPLFSVSWYLSQYSDVRLAGIEPLGHYVSSGYREGRDPHPLFFSGWYKQQMSFLGIAEMDPFLHFISIGWKEGMDPNPYFDTDWYLKQYPDVRDLCINPLIHYIQTGWKEGKEPNSAFDSTGYLLKHPESVGRAPLFHFIEEMRRTSPAKRGYEEAEDPLRYAAWRRVFESVDQRTSGRAAAGLVRRPRFSLVTAVYRAPSQYLRQLHDSLKAQEYDAWEWCIADGGSGSDTLAVLKEIAAKDARVKIVYLPENGGIAANTNAALALASGEFVAFVDHDDTLSPRALLEYAQKLNDHPDTDVLYSDEDKLSEDGQERSSPFFKPDWSPDLLRSINYMTHFLAIRKSLVDELGGLRLGFDGSQDYDLVLRATERARRIEHLPRVLYHWRMSSSSTASSESRKTWAAEAGRKALDQHLERTGVKGKAEIYYEGAAWWYDVRYAIVGEPLVTIIIPNKDDVGTLKRCLDSVFESTYTNLEILLVENNSSDPATFAYYDAVQKRDSRIRVVKWQGDFNYSAINNFAVKKARGEFLLLLNNDVEAINAEWLERLLGICQRKDVGAVGAMLLYPDNTVQHAGVVVGLGGCAGHSHKFYPATHPGYFRRLQMTCNYSAVTGACLMIRSSLYRELGGLNEKNLAVAFNDVDFCLRIRASGKLIVWTPRARLYHYESKTRGAENTPEKIARFGKEKRYMQGEWKEIMQRGDPYYSPNLVTDQENFAIRTRL
jgi:O-antigen biosynthesis protein